MQSKRCFKTESWRGVIRPDQYSPNELTTLMVRLPKDLADDVRLAVAEYRNYLGSEEELIVTAVGYAINSLAEEAESPEYAVQEEPKTGEPANERIQHVV